MSKDVIAAKTRGKLTDRLRGIYRIPITDGLGAVGAGEEPDNPNEFVRHFETGLIQHEAADVIDELVEALGVITRLANPSAQRFCDDICADITSVATKALEKAN